MRSMPVFAGLLMLAPLLMIQGCLTRSTEGDASLAAAATVLKLCNEAWRPITYSSSKDTPETVDEVRANNRARKAFCK